MRVSVSWHGHDKVRLNSPSKVQLSELVRAMLRAEDVTESVLFVQYLFESNGNIYIYIAI